MEEMFGPESAERKERLLSADLEAYLALAHDRPGLEDILPTMLMPCCLYAGEIDPIYPRVKTCSRHIPRVTFFSLPGLSHCEAYARSELVLSRHRLESCEYIVRRKHTGDSLMLDYLSGAQALISEAV